MRNRVTKIKRVMNKALSIYRTYQTSNKANRSTRKRGQWEWEREREREREREFEETATDNFLYLMKGIDL
jgi:hypothetical protein